MAGGFRNKQEFGDELTAEELLWVQTGAAGVLLLEEQGSSPSNTAGFGKVYVKTDKKLYYLDEDGVEIELGAGGGGSQTTETPTGDIDDSNLAFDFTEKPFLIVINHMTYRENSGWTWSGNTATLASPVGTGGDIYGILQ